MKENLMDKISIEFSEPIINEPKEKKKEKNKNTVRVVNLSGGKNKDKNKLF